MIQKAFISAIHHDHNILLMFHRQLDGIFTVLPCIFILISPNRMISLISQTAPPLVAFLSVVPSALWTLDKNMQNESLLYQTQDYLTVSAYSYTSDSLTWGVQELFGYLSSLFVASFSAICRFLNHPLYFLEDSRTWFSVLFLVNKDPQRSSFSYMLVT